MRSKPFPLPLALYLLILGTLQSTPLFAQQVADNTANSQDARVLVFDLLVSIDQQRKQLVDLESTDAGLATRHLKDQLTILENLQMVRKQLSEYHVNAVAAGVESNYNLLLQRITSPSLEMKAQMDYISNALQDLGQGTSTVPSEIPPSTTPSNLLPLSSAMEFEAVYTGEAMSVARGGLNNRSAYLNNVDLTLAIDTEQLFGWSGTTLFMYGLGNFGGSISDLAGDLQGISNIEAPTALRLYEAWFEKEFAGGAASLRTGLYDLNSEFYVLESAGLFLNGAHGIGPEFAGSGQNGPSIFPVTSLAMRLSFFPKNGMYTHLAVFDAVPGDLDNPLRTTVQLSREEGALLSGESGFVRGSMEEGGAYFKTGFGLWYYTSPFENQTLVDSNGLPLMQKGNAGVYWLMESTVSHESEDPTQGLTLFGRLGFANSVFNQVDLTWGAGMTYTGLLPNRPEDTLGLAVATARAGIPFLNANALETNPLAAYESSIELTYSLPLGDWVRIQPNIQYLINPGLDINRGHTLTIGHRFEIAF